MHASIGHADDQMPGTTWLWAEPWDLCCLIRLLKTSKHFLPQAVEEGGEFQIVEESVVVVRVLHAFHRNS